MKISDQIRTASDPSMPDSQTAIILGVALKAFAYETKNLQLSRREMAHKVNGLIQDGKIREPDAKIAIRVIQALRGIDWSAPSKEW